ncbi:MAG: DUF4332 domain-containing protein [Candidatus Thorarchaeota archaeon]
MRCFSVGLGAGVLLMLVLSTRQTDALAASVLLVPVVGVVCKSAADRRQVAETAKAVTAEGEAYVPEAVKKAAELTEIPIETLETLTRDNIEALRSNGILTMQDILETPADRLAQICGVSDDTAQRWVAAARFAWMESVSQEDSEAIVYGGGIMDLEELASADPAQLLERINTAVKLGQVKMPRGYKITLKDVEAWIREAKELV